MQTRLFKLVIPRFGRGEDCACPARRVPRPASRWAEIRILAWALAALSSNSGDAGTITLSPVADTSLFEYSPNNNLGGLDSVAAGTIRVLKRSRALFKFDVTQIPSNATIMSADLTLQVVMVPPAWRNTGSTFELHRVLRDWGEGQSAGPPRGSIAKTNEATWNNRFHPSTPWGQPGGSSNIDYVAAFSGTSFVSGIGPYTFSSTA